MKYSVRHSFYAIRNSGAPTGDSYKQLYLQGVDMPLFDAHLCEKALLIAGLSCVGACDGALGSHELDEPESDYHAAMVAERDHGNKCDASVTSLFDGGAPGHRRDRSCPRLAEPDRVGTASDAGTPFEPEGSAGDPPKFSAGGNGCLDAGARLTWAADKRSMHIEFDHLRAEVNAAGSWPSASSFCDLVLPVEGGRQTFAIKTITTSVQADLPDAVTASLLLMPSILGSPPKPENVDSHRLAAPMKGRTVVRSDFSNSLAFIPCGQARQIVLLARANIQGDFDMAPRSASFTVASMDIELAMRECKEEI